MKKVIIFLSIAVCLLISVYAQSTTHTLKVTAIYEGEGEVDSTHKIHLFLFDTPNVNSGSMPIAWNSSSENKRVVTFSGLTRSPVYLIAAYGNYEPTMGPPPSGTPVTVYEPGQPSPSPIELSEAETKIELKFDDTVRMP